MNREKRLDILKAIRDGKDFPRENRMLAPLEANGYIKVTKRDGTSYKDADVNLTEAGQSWIFFEEKFAKKQDIICQCVGAEYGCSDACPCYNETEICYNCGRRCE